MTDPKDEKATKPEVRDLEPTNDAKGGGHHGANAPGRNHGGLNTSIN